jgi:tetratricopeptide (TPR) repeat protein
MKGVHLAAVWLCILAVVASGHCFGVTDFQSQAIDPEKVQEVPEASEEAELAAILIRAKYYVVSGNTEKASETYREAIKKYPNCALAYFRLAGLLLRPEEIDLRIENLEKAIELDPGMKEAYESLGFSYKRKMETDKAIATYIKAIENVQDNLLFYPRLADAYLSVEKVKEAEEALMEGTNRHPASPESWASLIEFYATRRDYQKADETFEKALSATDNKLKFLGEMRILYDRREETQDRSLAVLVKTLELYPESAPMWFELVRRYLARGEKEKAREAAEKAISQLRYEEEIFNYLVVAYVNARDWDSAIEVLTKATTHHPNSLDMWRNLASLYEKKGEREKARECYRKILSMEPVRLQERQFLAQSYLAEKNYDQAIRELREAIGVFPNVASLRVDLADAYLASGQFEEGEKVYLNLAKARPGDSGVYVDLAKYYLKSDKPAKMQEAVDAALAMERDPARQAEICSELGEAAVEKRDMTSALKLLHRAAGIQSENPIKAYLLARAYTIAGDRENAAQHLRKAIQLAKTPQPAWHLMLAETYRALGKKDEARKSFSEATGILEQNCEKDPKNWILQYQLGQAYESAENDERAAEAYAECVELQPENGDLKYKLATVYSQLHLHEKAQEQLEKAIRLRSPKKPEWFVLLGEVYRTLTKRSEAAMAFEKAVAIVREEQAKKPLDSRAWAALGEVYNRARRYPEAIEALRKAVELAGDQAAPGLHIALAQALEGSGSTEGAREQYRKAAELLHKAVQENPDDPDDYLRLGLVYRSLYDFPKASEFLSKGIQLAGGNATASSYMSLADSLEKSDQAEKAEEEYQKAYSLLSDRVKEFPNDVTARYMLASVCERLGKLEECEEQYRAAMKLDPFFAAAYNNLGYTWIEENRNLEEAMALVRKALELDSDNGAYIDSLGWGYFKQGKLDEALSELLRAMKYEATDPAIFDHIGDVYKAKGMVEEAIEYWQKALEMNPNDRKIKEKIEQGRKALPSAEREK